MDSANFMVNLSDKVYSKCNDAGLTIIQLAKSWAHKSHVAFESFENFLPLTPSRLVSPKQADIVVEHPKHVTVETSFRHPHPTPLIRAIHDGSNF
jgi:hypothetical protein